MREFLFSEKGVLLLFIGAIILYIVFLLLFARGPKYDRIREFLAQLLFDDGKPSRTGFIGMSMVFGGFVSGFIVSLYVLLTKDSFPHYSIFLSWCGDMILTGAAVQTGNKAINAFRESKGTVPGVDERSKE